MDTSTAVLLSQIPLGIACFLAVYELYRIRTTTPGRVAAIVLAMLVAPLLARALLDRIATANHYRLDAVTPMWLFALVGGVWLTYGYVAVQVFKVWKGEA